MAWFVSHKEFEERFGIFEKAIQSLITKLDNLTLVSGEMNIRVSEIEKESGEIRAKQDATKSVLGAKVIELQSKLAKLSNFLDNIPSDEQIRDIAGDVISGEMSSKFQRSLEALECKAVKESRDFLDKNLQSMVEEAVSSRLEDILSESVKEQLEAIIGEGGISVDIGLN